MTNLSTKIEQATAPIRELGETAFWLSYGASIRERRKLAGLTQTDLADATAMSRPSIANIEAGRQRVSVWQDRIIQKIISDERSALRLKRDRLKKELADVNAAIKARNPT